MNMKAYIAATIGWHIIRNYQDTDLVLSLMWFFQSAVQVFLILMVYVVAEQTFRTFGMEDFE